MVFVNNFRLIMPCALQSSNAVFSQLQQLTTLIIIRHRQVHDYFHGTAISLQQHSDLDCPGIDRCAVFIGDSSLSSQSFTLPLQYASVPPARLITSEPEVPVPVCSETMREPSVISYDSLLDGQDWLNNVWEN